MSDYPFENTSYAFSVCRIEPENNIHVILEAFAEKPVMPVVIVGNWENSGYGRDLMEKYGEKPDIFLLSPIYDQVRLNHLRGRCALYLHGHSCGGTNPSLVEAMYLGLPVIAFDVNFNRETTENGALYFKDSTGLRDLVGGTAAEDRRRIGELMKSIADRRYTWKRIGERYASLL